jgi:hypothetical protein
VPGCDARDAHGRDFAAAAAARGFSGGSCGRDLRSLERDFAAAAAASGREGGRGRRWRATGSGRCRGRGVRELRACVRVAGACGSQAACGSGGSLHCPLNS